MATLAAPLIDKVPGANLRILMRQRLTEITGLTGEAVSQLVQSAPAEAPPSYDPYVDYDAMPDFADYQPQGGYEPQQEWTQKKTGGPNQKKLGQQILGQKRQTPGLRTSNAACTHRRRAAHAGRTENPAASPRIGGKG